MTGRNPSCVPHWKSVGLHGQGLWKPTLPSHIHYGISYLVPRPTINLVCLFQTGTGCFDDGWSPLFLWYAMALLLHWTRSKPPFCTSSLKDLIQVWSVKRHRRWLYTWKCHLLPKAFRHLSLHAQWRERRYTFSFLGSEESRNHIPPGGRCPALCRQVCWEGLALHRYPSLFQLRHRHSWCFAGQSISFGFFSSDTSRFDDRWSPLFRSPTKSTRKADPLGLISQTLASVVESQWAPFWKCHSCLKPPHWFLASQLQQGREHVNCSIQILLEAVQVLWVSNIWPCSATRMPILSETASRLPCEYVLLRIPSMSNRRIWITLCWRQLWEPTERSFSPRDKNRAKTRQEDPTTKGKCCIWMHMECTLGQTCRPTGCWLRKSKPRKLFLQTTSSWLLEMTGCWAAVTLFWHYGNFGTKTHVWCWYDGMLN